MTYFNVRLDASGVKNSTKNQLKEEKITRQIVDLAEERNFHLENLLTYELSCQNFLFECDGILKKEKSNRLLIQEI